MSASPVFSSAAVGRPFIFLGRSSPGCSSAALLAEIGALPKLSASVTSASHLHVRPAPEMVSSGIRELDTLTGGFPRGSLTEICGTASSGRTSILLTTLAQATRRGEVCALVDASDALHPASAAAAGINLERLLWIRCASQNPPRRHVGTEKFNAKNLTSDTGSRDQKLSEFRLEQVLKVTDLLLQSNGFGMIVLDLSDIPARGARRIPLASWFRFRRAIEHTPTVLLILEQQPIAGSCSSVLIKVAGKVSGVRCQVSGKKKKPSALSFQLSANQLAHAELLDEFEITAELLRSRLDRKQPQSVANFPTRAAWAS